MALYTGNHQFYLLPPAKSKPLLNPFLPSSVTFPNPPTTYGVSPPKPLFCRATATAIATATGDTETLPQSAIQRIAEKLRGLGYVEDDKDENKDEDKLPKNGPSPGEIFVPLPSQLPKYRVGHTLDPSWSTPQNPVPLPGSGNAIQKYHQLRRGVIKERIEERKKRETVPTLAELNLPEGELRRLRTLGIRLQKKLKVGKAGITEGIVNGIHERWRRYEVVKIRCEDICRMNMKRTHELLEMKTGGLVVWRSGTNIVLYRGADYKYPYFFSDDNTANGSLREEASVDFRMDYREDNEKKASSSGGNALRSSVPKSLSKVSHPPLIQGVGTPNRVRFQLPGEAQLAEEADRLLEGLGPRFTDWWGYEPLPVDADFLPAAVPGYRRPFRLLPYGVKPILTNDEMTFLRRLGRPLPCHFALGRNRKLQGLAAAIIKLWEKCEIAKIAVKRGVQNTNSELMAEELKNLTGGTLLSRDKEFIVLYRGKDFLPAAVSLAIEKRRNYVLDGEEKGADKSFTTVSSKDQRLGTSENCNGDENNGKEDQKLELASKRRHRSSTEAAIERTSAKLSKALVKKDMAEKLLVELEKEETTQEPEVDKEGITEEERYMLRKIGLRMKPFLLLGRRGVFDGTIENMHLHWKYRELVKIITGGRSIEEVTARARTLEAESGGILVAVERVSKGFAIIVYRGKNYSRPACLRPRSLLSKREAMKRSLEAQRRESLKLHVLKLTQNIDRLKLQLAKEKGTNKTDLAEELKLKLDEEQEPDKFHSSKNKMSLASPELSPQSLSTSHYNEQTLGVTRTSAIGTMEAKLGGTKAMHSPADSMKTELDSSVHVVKESGCNAILVRAKSLSNRDRLLLRKQALKMKKHHVFAIGKSNKVSGLAEAIKVRFQKYPLAIVNVKGRAKGTSVQEVVFKLEQATGAVLVSQEPSKVILYRGWGAGEPTTHGSRESTTDSRYFSGREGRTPHAIPHDLMSAIRLECGLQPYNEKESTS
ncbi:CRM-domain containing factor CFM2, chloroplastic-like [Coffea arabica]|uniref:CRM-domain containing factor CFM2, chloroplastic-like n=1 Tax=Coffea arabica TaxID=13443 RepID=A0A6P6T9K6_COFAR